MTFTKKASLVASVLVLPMMAPEIATAQDDFTIKLGGRLHVNENSCLREARDYPFGGALATAR